MTLAMVLAVTLQIVTIDPEAPLPPEPEADPVCALTGDCAPSGGQAPAAPAPAPSAPDRLEQDELHSAMPGAPNDRPGVEALAPDLRFAFAPRKAKLAVAERDRCARLAKGMREFPRLRLSIEGHVSRRGMTRTQSLALSQARADAVRRCLIEQGIASARAGAVGFGFERPFVPSDDDPANDVVVAVPLDEDGR